MRNLVMALIFPLAMGTMVSCTEKTTYIKEKEVKDNSLILFSTGSANDNDDSDVVAVSSSKTTKTTTSTSEPKSQNDTECDCLAVENKFAEIKANRNDSYSTATAQLRAELNNKPSCLIFNGNSSWSCGKYSGRDSGDAESQLVIGGF